MRLGGNANYVATITSAEEIQHLYHNCQKLNQPLYIIGGGSNLIVRDEGYPGVIALNRIPGITVTEDNEESTTVSAGSGEIWDNLVAFSVARNLSGIEAMSGIPGTVGAAPVQNIGAYGQELADTFISLEAYDTQNDRMTLLTWEDCAFSYRHSIFRGDETGRYIITKVTLTLYKKQPQPPFYKSLQQYLDTNQVDPATITPQTIRDAVLAIRSEKLPDPSVLPNAGSFFKNPIIERWQADDLKQRFDGMPMHEMDDEHVKIPAGWLIEMTGLKEQDLGAMKLHDKNALVLINQSATSYQQLDEARTTITNAVRDMFQIHLEQEPLELSITS